MRVGAAFLQTSFTQGIQMVASVATGVLIARGLGPAGQGAYAVLFAAVGLFSMVAAAGQFEGHVLTSAGEASRGRILLVRSLLQAGAVAVAILLSQRFWRPGLGLGAEGRLAPLFGLVLIGETLALLLRGINLGQHHITAYNLATLVQRLCYLTGVLAFTIGRGLALPNVLAAWLGAVALSVLMTGAWIWRRSAAVDISWRRIRDGWGRSLGKGLRALLTISLTLLLIRADVYMLGPMLGKATVGQVSVASSLAEYLWYVPTILGSVLFAAVAADRGPDTVAKICRGSRTMVLGLVPAAMLLAIAGRPLVTFIYGSSYAMAGTLFVLLLPGMLAIALHLIIDSFFTGSGYPAVSYLSAAGALVCKVGLNLVAVPRFGVVGAVTVTSLVYLALLSVKVAAFTRQAGVGLPSLFSPTWSDVTHGVGLVRSWTRRAAGRVPAPGA